MPWPTSISANLPGPERLGLCGSAIRDRAGVQLNPRWLDLAKQRRRKAKVWRLLNEGKETLTEPNASPTKVAQAKDTLDIANKLGLDDEQQAIYQQLQEKLQQRHTQSS